MSFWVSNFLFDIRGLSEATYQSRNQSDKETSKSSDENWLKLQKAIQLNLGIKCSIFYATEFVIY